MRLGFCFLVLPAFVLVGCVNLPFGIAQGAKTPVYPDCLNLSPSRSAFRPPSHPECINDVLKLGENRSVRGGEDYLGIAPQEVSFIGCSAAPFVTFPGHGLSSSKPTIYYPTGGELSLDDYIAPLLHELGHVFQLKHAGSYEKLMTALDNSIERVELGADFIAGFGASHLGLEPRAFLINLSLFGSYNNQDSDNHGRPEDRTAAFREGYFYSNKHATVADSYSDFEDNRYAQIKHM